MLTELLLSQVKQGFQHGWPTHPEYTNQVKSSALKGGVGCCGFWVFFPSSLFVCFNTNLFFFFIDLISYESRAMVFFLSAGWNTCFVPRSVCYFTSIQAEGACELYVGISLLKCCMLPF